MFRPFARRVSHGVLYALALLLGSCGSDLDSSAPRMMVVGFDGIDPKILQRLMDEGKLPNFQAVAKQGGFSPLKTSIPPESPIAWSNVISGADPGEHGIFDFVHRRFSGADKLEERHLELFMSTALTDSGSTWSFGDLQIPKPWDAGGTEEMRQGPVFWNILQEQGIPASIVRIPANYPPTESEQRTFPGMGTPDLPGTYGTCFQYTSDPAAIEGEAASGAKIKKVRVRDDAVTTTLEGPPDPFQKGNPMVTTPLTVLIDRENQTVDVKVGSEDVVLKVGEFSDWVPVSFDLITAMGMPLEGVSGICRFKLQSLEPHFKLYVTPIQIDPRDPFTPVSTPDDASEELAEKIGPYYTQGMAEDTAALRAGIFTPAEYLEQVELVWQERMSMLDYELDRFEDAGGFLFFYFSSTDLVSHMMWRFSDPDHPNYDPDQPEEVKLAIENIYQRADEAVGEIRKRIGEDTPLMIISDHGFAPYYRALNLNTWLWQNGYLAVKDPSKLGSAKLLEDVDWSKTKAYALGFNALYLNLRGREPKGIVMPSEKDALLAEIDQKLRDYKDPKNGESVVLTNYLSETQYHGEYATGEYTPDMIIGYASRYRAHDDTVEGLIVPASEVIQDNMDAWSGCHLMAAEVVPGVLLSNRPIKLEDPALYDVTVTVMDFYGVPESQVGRKAMIGRSILDFSAPR
ncbi:MAG: alkaline phosphatase family protein [Planctomycetota bacterium]